MLKIISVAGCLGLSPVISAQFTLEMCVAATNREKITKNPYFGVQGRSRSSTLVTPESSLAASLCLSATVLLLDWTTVAETARFEEGTQI